MPSTESIVTDVDGTLWDAWEADDGTDARIRDGQTVICNAFDNKIKGLYTFVLFPKHFFNGIYYNEI